MANNLTAFQTEIQTLLTNTVNIDNTTKVELRDAVITENQTAYNYWLASFSPARTDTNANRAEFVAKYLLDTLKNIVRSARVHAQVDPGTIT